MQPMSVGSLMRVIAVVVALVAVLAPAAHADPPAPIENAYSQPGPWAVTSRLGFACCDSAGTPFDIWYPTNLGAGGVRHPIITWGDGTIAVPRQYTYLLAHLASWGFVVIASESQSTGNGQVIGDAANYLRKQSADPASPFYRKLDTHAVGAVGHSQGATGALNAASAAPALFKTVVTFELPGQIACLGNILGCADTRRLKSGSVFFVNGADDPVSPPTQAVPWQAAGLQSDQAYYEATPAPIPKAWAMLLRANHNDVQGQPTCATASWPCTTGVFGYLGYPTAWLRDRLMGDTRAHSVFVNRTGELFAETANWSDQTSNITS